MITSLLRDAFLLDWESCEGNTDFDSLSRAKSASKLYPCVLPCQVHEILVRNGAMADPVITHRGEESEAVSRRDWCYVVPFDYMIPAGKLTLRCLGLDTIVDIYLNGSYVGSHNDMFFPFEAEITRQIQPKNVLLFHFHSPLRYIEDYSIPPKEKPYLKPSHYLRKATHDFEGSLGLKPCFAGIGIFDEIQLVEHTPAEILRFDPSYTFGDANTDITLQIDIRCAFYQKGNYRLEYSVTGPDGKCIFQSVHALDGDNPETDSAAAVLSGVQLWWPAGYGEQPLYRVQVKLRDDEAVLAETEKEIGFREITMDAPFHFKVNGVKIRLWGANLVPVTGLTHCFQEERTLEILRLAKQANMNTIRVWGGGEPLPNRFYSMADREGLLLWCEFFHKWGMSPESGPFLSLYRKEAEYLIQMAKHHPSVLMWCGGNESQMGAQRDFPQREYIGKKIFEMYGELCAELDSGRFYWPNSPYGSEFYNDPAAGDFHGWNHLWYIPGTDYPIMFSENSRVSPPGPATMRRYLPNREDYWPAGFNCSLFKHDDSLLPPAWMQLKVGPEPYWCSPIEQFYDAETPEQLLYKCGMAHGQFMKRCGERLKRGRPHGAAEQICTGQLIWKLNDSWPQIFCSLLDYYLEPYIPYYCVKRAFAPLQVSFDIGDRLGIWGVNDTACPVEGKLTFLLYDPVEDTAVYQEEKQVLLPGGESALLLEPERLWQFRRRNILYACLTGQDGTVLARNYDFAEIERNLFFPPAKLTLQKAEGGVKISTDRFARCVELSGEAEGNTFGFFFEDNYFDLMPFETRTIAVSHPAYSSFTLHAKAHYSPQTQALQF